VLSQLKKDKDSLEQAESQTRSLLGRFEENDTEMRKQLDNAEKKLQNYKDKVTEKSNRVKELETQLRS
jgi:predicted  nucleic acid-binding Zn-ribbon protein